MAKELSGWPCSVARSAELFGDAWTTLIMRDLFYGLVRFDDFQSSLGIARNTLSDRLGRLVEAGVVAKRLYQDNPPRNEYYLTEKGRDFFPVLAAMVAWGDKWLDGGAGPPVVLQHKVCGHDSAARVTCTSCGEPIVSDDIEFQMGPGYPGDPECFPEFRARLRRRAS